MSEFHGTNSEVKEELLSASFSRGVRYFIHWVDLKARDLKEVEK